MILKRYKSLRNKIYKLTAEMRQLAEVKANNLEIVAAADKLTLSLNDFNSLGYRLGYVDPETNELIKNARSVKSMYFYGKDKGVSK